MFLIYIVSKFIILCRFFVISDCFGTDIEYPDTGPVPTFIDYNPEDDYKNTTGTVPATGNTTSLIKETVSIKFDEDIGTENKRKTYSRQNAPNNNSPEDKIYNKDDEAYDYLGYGSQPENSPYKNQGLNLPEKNTQFAQTGKRDLMKIRQIPAKKIVGNSMALYQQGNANINSDYSIKKTHLNRPMTQFDLKHNNLRPNPYPIPDVSPYSKGPTNPSEFGFYMDPKRGRVYGKLTTKSNPTYFSNDFNHHNYNTASKNSNPNNMLQDNIYNVNKNVQLNSQYMSQGRATDNIYNKQMNVAAVKGNGGYIYKTPPTYTNNIYSMNSQKAMVVGLKSHIIGHQEQSTQDFVGTGPNIYQKQVDTHDNEYYGIYGQENSQNINRDINLGQNVRYETTIRNIEDLPFQTPPYAQEMVGDTTPIGFNQIKYVYDHQNSMNIMPRPNSVNLINNPNIYHKIDQNLNEQHYGNIQKQERQELIAPQNQIQLQPSVVQNQDFISQRGYNAPNPEAYSNNAIHQAKVETLNTYQNVYSPKHYNPSAQHQANQDQNIQTQTVLRFNNPESHYIANLRNLQENTQGSKPQNPEESNQNPTKQNEYSSPDSQTPNTQNQGHNPDNQNQDGNQYPDPANNSDKQTDNPNPYPKTDNQSENGNSTPQNPDNNTTLQNPHKETESKISILQAPEEQKRNTTSPKSEGQKVSVTLQNSTQQQDAKSQNTNASLDRSSLTANKSDINVSNNINRTTPETAASRSFDYNDIPGWYELQFSTLPGVTTRTVNGTTVGFFPDHPHAVSPTTPPNHLVVEAKQMMSSFHWGYFLGFTHKLFQILLKKNHSEIMALFLGLKTVIDSMVDSGVLKDLGSPAAPALKNVMLPLLSWGFENTISQLEMASAMLRERHQALAEDVVEIIDIVDASYTLEEGDKFLESLVEIDEYPNNFIPPVNVAGKMLNRLLQPFWRTAGTPNRATLIKMINSAIQARYPSRRFNINNVSKIANSTNNNDNNWFGNAIKKQREGGEIQRRQHKVEQENRFDTPRNNADSVKFVTSAIRSYFRRIPYAHKLKAIKNHRSLRHNRFKDMGKSKFTTRKLKTKQKKYDRLRQNEYNYEKSLKNRIPHTSEDNIYNWHDVISTNAINDIRKSIKTDSTKIYISDTEIHIKISKNTVPDVRKELTKNIGTKRTVLKNTENYTIQSIRSIRDQKNEKKSIDDTNIINNNESLQNVQLNITKLDDTFSKKSPKIKHALKNDKYIFKIKAKQPKNAVNKNSTDTFFINFAKQVEVKSNIAKINKVAIKNKATENDKSQEVKLSVYEIKKAFARKEVEIKTTTKPILSQKLDKYIKSDYKYSKNKITINNHKQTKNKNEATIRQSQYLLPFVRQDINITIPKIYKKSKEERKKDTLRNIIEESSYSDEEDQLKLVLSDAIRHSDFRNTRKNEIAEVSKNRRNNKVFEEKKTSNEQSKYSDEEAILKNNIYRAFGYNPDYNIKHF